MFFICKNFICGDCRVVKATFMNKRNALFVKHNWYFKENTSTKFKIYLVM